MSTSAPSVPDVRASDLSGPDPAVPEPRATDEGARARRRPLLRSPTARWLWVTALTALVAGLLPLLWDGRFYFKGDTQAGAFGQWVHLGRAVRAGSWPVLDLPSWRAGNFISEGQWGLFSPLTLAVAVLASLATSAVLFCTVVKLVLLMGAAVGTHLLVRSYGTRPATAYAAGVAVTLGGTTVYLESPSWVTGQMVWALLPFAWWALRRTMRGANPLPALASGYLVVTVGYVYGTIYLALVVAVCLLDAGLARDGRAALRVLGVGVCSGLVAVTVYLPGILSASVTTRAGFAVVSEGRLQGDLTGLLASMLPTVQPAGAAEFPVHYLAWFLPVLCWLDGARVRAAFRPLAGLTVMLGLVVAWVLGPNAVGPIRWPVRVLPVVVLCAVVLLAVLLDAALPDRPSAGRLVASLAWVAAAAYLVVSRHWDLRGMTAVSAVVVALGLLGAWLVARGRAPRGGGTGRLVLTRTALAVFVVLWSLLVVVVQHAYFPGTPSVDRNMPSRTADYASAAAAAVGDTMVVGDAEDAAIKDPAVASDFLVASSWYAGPQTVQSVYTTIGFATYNTRYCIRYNGTTCRSALTRLLEDEPLTGRPRIDLLSISSLQIVRAGISDRRLLRPPAGWRVAYQSSRAVTWVRETPLPSAGGVVWTSPQLEVTQTGGDARHLRLRLDRVPASGGTVVLSRLAWPGYRVSGGQLAAPTDGYLLSVTVPPGATGTEVAVDYDPPAWPLERAALVTSVAAGLLWSLVAGAFALRRRRVASHPVP